MISLNRSGRSPMIKYEIASYQPSDQEELLQFFQSAFGEMGFAFELDSKDKDLRRIPDEYQSNGGIFLLARHDRQIIGTIALHRIEQTTCELKRFYVKEAYQRRGVGKSLLVKVINHARDVRFSRIRLDTTSKSPSAISLFRKHGFVEIARYNNDPFAEIFMELRLD